MYLITVDDIMTDVNFLNNNGFTNFLILTIIAESGQVEESQHHISLSHNRARKVSNAAVYELSLIHI